MRHGRSGRKLSRSSSHRRALATSQATALLREGRINTTIVKAKELRPYIEHLITVAKGGTLHDRRIVAQDIHDREVLQKLFNDVAPKYQDRNGGYTRILRTGFRRGDAAETALIELVD